VGPSGSDTRDRGLLPVPFLAAKRTSLDLDPGDGDAAGRGRGGATAMMVKALESSEFRSSHKHRENIALEKTIIRDEDTIERSELGAGRCCEDDEDEEEESFSASRPRRSTRRCRRIGGWVSKVGYELTKFQRPNSHPDAKPVGR
jgi:hypothetical protein